MTPRSTQLSGIVTLEPRVFSDPRGYFYESYNQRAFEQVTGLNPRFVQDNHSCSARGVLRGLHYQIRQSQGKLVRVTTGEIYDVAVDLRRSSPTFGCWMGEVLSAANRCQLWIPEGFAHGFLVLSDLAEVLYKTTDYYAPEYERCLRWDDPTVGIRWPLDDRQPILSARDAAGLLLPHAEVFEDAGLAAAVAPGVTQ